MFSNNFIKNTEFTEYDGIFQDAGHLNHEGATKFSNIIAKKINLDLER